MRLHRRFTLMAAAAALALSAFATPAAAGVISSATVWVAHGIPGVAVDVCVGGDAVRADFRYGQRFPANLPAGRYVVKVRALGHGGPCSGALLIRQAITLKSGANITALAVVRGGVPVLVAWENYVLVPAGGYAPTITVHHEAKAPAVDVWLTSSVTTVAPYPSQPAITSLARGEAAGPIVVEEDVYSFWVSASGGLRPVIGPAARSFVNGRAYQIIAVGDSPANYRFITFSNAILGVCAAGEAPTAACG